jgi:hypothetical protein
MNKTDRQPQKIDLRLDLENFGPLSAASIGLKPLTLFVGQNNSGKSYTAMLVHSIIESYGPTAQLQRYSHFAFEVDDMFLWRGAINNRIEEFEDLKRFLESTHSGGDVEIPVHLVEKTVHKILDGIYETGLRNEITRSFACQPGDLVRVGQKHFTLKIGTDSIYTTIVSQKRKLHVKEYPKITTRIKIRVSESPRRRQMEAHEQGDEIVVFVGASFWKQEQERYFFIGAIVQSLISKLLKNARRPCYYLPAARSGILQGHKALAAGLIRKAPYVGLEPLEIPRLSGVIVEFISTLLNLPDRKGPLYSFAQGLERELIKGEVIARSGGESSLSRNSVQFSSDRDSHSPIFLHSLRIGPARPLFEIHRGAELRSHH